MRPRHQGDEEFAGPAEEAVVHDLVLVGLEDIGVGEAFVFLGADVKIAAERGGRAGGESREFELGGTRDAVGVVVKVGEFGEELHAAGDEGGGGGVGREDTGEELILHGGPEDGTGAGHAGQRNAGADAEHREEAAALEIGAGDEVLGLCGVVPGL